MSRILITGDIVEINGFMCGVDFVNDSAIVIEDCGDGWALLSHGACEEDRALKLVAGELYFVRYGVETLCSSS